MRLSMKIHSIKFKITMLMVTVIAVLVTLLIVINSIFAEKVYVKTKQQTMKESYESVDEMETSLNETLEFIESLYQSQIITKSEYNNYCTRIENRAKKSYKTVPSN